MTTYISAHEIVTDACAATSRQDVNSHIMQGFDYAGEGANGPAIILTASDGVFVICDNFDRATGEFAGYTWARYGGLTDGGDPDPETFCWGGGGDAAEDARRDVAEFLNLLSGG